VYLLCVYSDGKVTPVEAVVTPVNADTVNRSLIACDAVASESILPDEPPSSLLAIVAGDEPSTHSTVTFTSPCLPAYDTDVIAESAAVVDISTPAVSAASFITSSSCAVVTESYLPCESVHADIDMVSASDCLLQTAPDDDEAEMTADEQIEDWDHEVFDPWVYFYTLSQDF